MFKKNFKTNFLYLYKTNKNIFYLFAIFIIFLIFQVVPLPNFFLSFISENSFNFYKNINFSNYNPISLNIYFSSHEIINYLNIFLIVVLTNLIFYKKKHINRFLFYFSIMGFFHAFFAVFWLLNGNPDFIFKDTIYYSNSATGFFINRTNFSFFLVLTFLIGLQYLYFNNIKMIFKEDKFEIFYVRFFLLFISIGIISTFSRLGNFYLLIIVLYYLLISIINTNKLFNRFSIFFIVLILFDILIMGVYFGGNQLISRFDFFNYELLSNPNNQVNLLSSKDIEDNLSRLKLISLGFEFFKSYFYFGYGAGAFESAFFLLFENLNDIYANHAHSDFVELLGELGIFGFIIFILLFINILYRGVDAYIGKYSNLHFLLIPLLLLFLFNGFFDFSLNIPSNQFLFASLVTMSLKKYF
jgi:O-antigen ligase